MPIVEKSGASLEKTHEPEVLAMTTKFPRIIGMFDRSSSRARLSSEGAGRFRLEGEVGFGTAMHLLHESRALFEHEERVRLDFSGVERINSAGLALVIEWLREARHESRTLEISNPPAGLMAMARICDVEGLIQSILVRQHVGPARQAPDTPA